MPKRKVKPDHISQEDWDAVDSPPLTDRMRRNLRPVREIHPEIVQAYHAFKRGRGPQKAPVKKLVSLRLDQDVLEHFQGEGEGWQTRINEALRKAIEHA